MVWAEGKTLAKDVPWPYQLARIEVVQFNQKFAKLYPQSAKPGSAEMRGFMTFKNECIRCHSINLQGGDLGPELNAPKSITEYWDRKILKAFIQNKSEEIDDVLEYLSFMKDRKVTL